MLKTLHSVDEVENSVKKDAFPLKKAEKLVKKEMLDREKSIDPKAIFNDYKKSKFDKGKNYRQPSEEAGGKPKKKKDITLMDY
jgi:hypothetical protein